MKLRGECIRGEEVVCAICEERRDLADCTVPWLKCVTLEPRLCASIAADMEQNVPGLWLNHPEMHLIFSVPLNKSLTLHGWISNTSGNRRAKL